jgi:hypothetical protein
MNKMADNYNPDESPPAGALVRAEVLVFADGSIHVGGQVSPFMGGDNIVNGEQTLSTALTVGLELLGYNVDVTEAPDGVGDGVECISVGNAAAISA